MLDCGDHLGIIAPVRCGALMLGLVLTVGCAKKDLRYCDSDTPCTLLEFPYCDEDGSISGIRNNCIPAPGGADASVFDASMSDSSLADANWFDASVTDASTSPPGLGALCTLDGSSAECPVGSQCWDQPNNPTDLGWCSPPCDPSTGVECLGYAGEGEAICAAHGDGSEPRCVVAPDPTTGSCPDGFAGIGGVFDVNGDGVATDTDLACLPIVSGLGADCATESCPAGNECSGDPSTGPTWCGPGCGADSDCEGFVSSNGKTSSCVGVLCGFPCAQSSDCPPELPDCTLDGANGYCTTQ